ncbi:hypothetical protein ACIRL0_36485 [Streptomyces sp. NPDC102365]|uniref:hypothetical protein n=1 Tax=Streptomyces sp. NPDC102365 TaxID=3366162 RepID=UPI00381E9F0F
MPARPTDTRTSPADDVREESNPSRLRRESAELRRTLAVYEEAIRRLALENDALRGQGVVVALPARTTPASS